MDYKKLSEVSDFQIIAYYGYKWKRYNEETRKSEVSEKWQQGFSKRYTITIQTQGGQFYLELSQSQVSQMLENCLDKDGKADLMEKYFKVKTNGKQGKEIRYFINRYLPTTPMPQTTKQIAEEQGWEVQDTTDYTNVENIPF